MIQLIEGNSPRYLSDIDRSCISLTGVELKDEVNQDAYNMPVHSNKAQQEPNSIQSVKCTASKLSLLKSPAINLRELVI